jgi:hypothetical protein
MTSKKQQQIAALSAGAAVLILGLLGYITLRARARSVEGSSSNTAMSAAQQGIDIRTARMDTPPGPVGAPPTVVLPPTAAGAPRPANTYAVPANPQAPPPIQPQAPHPMQPPPQVSAPPLSSADATPAQQVATYMGWLAPFERGRQAAVLDAARKEGGLGGSSILSPSEDQARRLQQVYQAEVAQWDAAIHAFDAVTAPAACQTLAGRYRELLSLTRQRCADRAIEDPSEGRDDPKQNLRGAAALEDMTTEWRRVNAAFPGTPTLP